MLLSHESYLVDFNSRLNELALTNIEEAIESKHYTGPELLAMKTFEELRLISGLDLISLILKGERLKSIREMNLSALLPGKYGSMEEAIQAEAKISRTQQSIITNLYETIFPYVQEELNMPIQEFWEEVSMSNAGEITPHLRMLITEQPSKSEGVRSKVENLLEEKAEELTDRGEEPDTAEVKRMAVQELISMSAGTNLDVRKELRPDGTPPVLLTVIRTNGSRFILAEITEDQLTMLNRAFGRHLDIHYHTEALDTLPTFKQLVETI